MPPSAQTAAITIGLPTSVRSCCIDCVNVIVPAEYRVCIASIASPSAGACPRSCAEIEPSSAVIFTCFGFSAACCPPPEASAAHAAAAGGTPAAVSAAAAGDGCSATGGGG